MSQGISHYQRGMSHCCQHSYSTEADKENVGNAGHYKCYDPPLPNTNGQLQQWEARGLSYTNNSYDNRWDANEESAAGALLNFSGNQGGHIGNYYLIAT
jgi:hypothetical protein